MFLLFGVVSLFTLCPLLYAVWRVAVPRGRRTSALELHRAQLVELDREHAEGRIGMTEHAGARLEVQRRLLAEAETRDDTASVSEGRTRGTTQGTRGLLVLAVVLMPLAAAGLYLIDGQPQLASAVPATLVSRVQQDAEADTLIATLRRRLGTIDPKTEIASQGYMLLGNAEASRGHMREAATAWRMALEAGFNPALAAQAAETQFQVDGKMSDETASLYRRALAEAPPDAPWRGLVQQRLGNRP